MKRLLSILFFCIALAALQSCGSKHENDHNFVGTFVDEYNNVFTLNEDRTATITINGAKEFKTTWYDGDDHKRPYATIEYNGDPCYYFLRDGSLYRYKEEMDDGRCAIKITYKE